MTQVSPNSPGSVATRTHRMRLSVRLPVTLASIALVVGLLCSGVVLALGISAVIESDKSRLMTVTKARATALSDYLETINSDLHFQSENPLIATALDRFKTAWATLSEEPQTSVSDHLRRLYIDENPHPVGRKDELDQAKDGSDYSAVHAIYHPWLRTFLRDRGYYDLFLIDQQGNLVYSVFKELDYATNVLTGEYKSSGLGNVARALIHGEAPLAFEDFSPYAPSYGAPAAFVGTPVFGNDGKRHGALIFQFPIDRVNALMQNAVGLGETGETVIVGQDKLMRSASRFSKDSTILNTKLDLAVVDRVLAGESGLEDLKISRPGFNEPTSTVTAYEQVSFHGTSFAILGMITKDELFAPAWMMTFWALVAVGVVLLATIAFGLLLSRSISRPIIGLRATMTEMASGNHNLIVPEQNRGDEIGEMAEAVEVFRQNMAENQRLQAEAADRQRMDRERADRLRLTTQSFETDAQSMSESVAVAAAGLETTAQMLNKIAEQSQQRTTMVSAASEQTSANVQTVATASTELAASITEISRQVSHANVVSRSAREEAEATQSQVQDLANAAEQIGAVVNLIQEIAEQTNLLALNATIESARAGEAGKGFAVVAQEVKHLAGQTAKATEEISSQIHAVQDRTRNAVSAIAKIVGRVGEVQEVAANVAAAVEEQDSATKEISRNVEEVSAAASEVNVNIADLRDAAGRTGNSSGEVLTTARELSRQAEALRARVDGFLEDVRSA